MTLLFAQLTRCVISVVCSVFLGFGCSVAFGAPQAAAPKEQAGPSATQQADFAAAADEVLNQMSEITGLKLRTPLKKSLRSREQIRAYVIREMNEDKDSAERYAGQRSAEAFGLLPRGFDLDAFMIDLLTEQIAGLYDPKSHEFYVADWTPIADQKMVMAHELTHALEDQHFQIDAWVKSARPNDDAELAREAVLEGSAMAAMVDFLLQGTGRSLQDLPDIDPSMFVGDMSDTPMFKKAPPFIKDALVFPYLDGLNFSAAIMRSVGWSKLTLLFEKPPVSTQQIMHPALYQSGKTPVQISLPPLDAALGSAWKKLEDNIMGEFGWKEVLKQFLGEARAKPVSALWAADRYVVYEQRQNKHLVLATRLQLATAAGAAQFFATYSEALEKKYQDRKDVSRQPADFSFGTADGGVFLRCAGRECLTLEGADASLWKKLNEDIHLGDLPAPQNSVTTSTSRRTFQTHSALR
jgi:hypothetical protein